MLGGVYMKLKKKLMIAILLCLNIMCTAMSVDAAKEQDKLTAPTLKLSNVASTGKIKITWKKIAGAKNYKLYNSTDGKKWKLIKTTTNTSVTNVSIEAGEKYYYRAKAIGSDTSLNSAYSKVQSRVCDLPRPEVTLKKVKSTGKIKITWKKIEGAKSYKVYL